MLTYVVSAHIGMGYPVVYAGEWSGAIEYFKGDHAKKWNRFTIMIWEKGEIIHEQEYNGESVQERIVAVMSNGPGYI